MLDADNLRKEHVTISALHFQTMYIKEQTAKNYQLQVLHLNKRVPFRKRMRLLKKIGNFNRRMELDKLKFNKFVIKKYLNLYGPYVHPEDRYNIENNMTLDQFDEFIPKLIGIGSSRIASEISKTDQNVGKIKVEIAKAAQKEAMQKLPDNIKSAIKMVKNQIKKED